MIGRIAPMVSRDGRNRNEATTFHMVGRLCKAIAGAATISASLATVASH